MVEKLKIYDKARLITVLCCFAIILSLISINFELTKADVNLLIKIPEKLVFALWNISLGCVLHLMKIYIQEFYQQKIVLLNVAALLFFMLVPLDAIAELSFGSKFMFLSIIITLALPILFLISGLQVREVGKKRNIGTLLVIYASLIIASMFISLGFTIDDEFPIIFYSFSTLIDVGFLSTLIYLFRKLCKKRNHQIYLEQIQAMKSKKLGLDKQLT